MGFLRISTSLLVRTTAAKLPAAGQFLQGPANGEEFLKLRVKPRIFKREGQDFKPKFTEINNKNQAEVFRRGEYETIKVKVKVNQSRYRPGIFPEGSRKLRFPDFMTTAQEVGKVVSHTHRPHLPPGNPPGTHLC